MALALGLAVGVGIVFLLDKLNNTFRTPLQVETLTGETVLGTIPAIGRRLHRQDVVRQFRNNPKSSLAESIRSLRTSILFSNVDTPPKVVMFTSSVPREAKSTTSMLVAMTSQQMGKSAIIVDCDLRLPSLARLLNADDGKPGLLSVIEGSAELDEAIFLDPETGLHVLMTKPSEPRTNLNAADILSSRKFDQILAALKKRYDLVILDTPPTLVVADARILSTHADAVV
jgi:capsular exopolysaccharide synthesis family protein